MNREQLLESCKEIVLKHRQSEYGKPEDSFYGIANMWSTYLQRKFGHDIELLPHDVAAMMVLLKVVRSINSPTKTDNWQDMAGYAACGCEVATEDLKEVAHPPTPKAVCSRG